MDSDNYCALSHTLLRYPVISFLSRSMAFACTSTAITSEARAPRQSIQVTELESNRVRAINLSGFVPCSHRAVIAEKSASCAGPNPITEGRYLYQERHDRESWLRCVLHARKGNLGRSGWTTSSAQRESYLRYLLQERKRARGPAVVAAEDDGSVAYTVRLSSTDKVNHTLIITFS
jgi:hypothetical protein